MIASIAWTLGAGGAHEALPWLVSLSPPLALLAHEPEAKGPQLLALAMAALAVAAAWGEAGRGWAQTRRFVRERAAVGSADA